MLAFLFMHCEFLHQNFRKPRWTSTINQKYHFVITSLTTTYYEYGIKFLAIIQNKKTYGIYTYFSSYLILSFMLEDEQCSSTGGESLHHLWLLLSKYCVVKSSSEQEEKGKKGEKEKKEEERKKNENKKKRKVRTMRKEKRKREEKKEKRQK